MSLKLTRRGKSKVWYARGSVRGKRYFESTGTSSREHAEAWRRKRETEILDGTYLAEGNTSFAEAVEFYMEKGGEGRYLDLLLDVWGNTKLNEITPAEVSRVSRELFAAKSPATVKRQLYVPLNAVMKKAHAGNMAPLYQFEAPQVKLKPAEYADDTWLRAFVDNAHFQISAIVMFMSLTAARVTEACNLEPKDVDPEQMTCLLRKTKNGKPRVVALAPETMRLLQRAIATCAKEIDGTVRVFGYAERFSVNQAIERVCRRAGLPYLSSHKVGRHSFAARMLSQGNSLKVVQEAGGWASITVLSAVYGHLERGVSADATRRAQSSAPQIPDKSGAKSVQLVRKE
jgi:integrase